MKTSYDYEMDWKPYVFPDENNRITAKEEIQKNIPK